jgi:hypothetical protein
MICDHEESVGAFQVTTPDSECMDYCQEFLFACGVVNLSRGLTTTLKSNRALVLEEE